MADLAAVVTLQRAERFIQTVVRAFYEDLYIVVVDVLIREKYLKDKDEELGARMNLAGKQVRAVLSSLQNEGLVRQESVPDVVGGTRSSNYWYIDYKHAVDVIRLRIYLMQKRLKQEHDSASLARGYICPRCGTRFGLLRVQQLKNSVLGFCCNNCCQNDDHSDCGPEPYSLVNDKDDKGVRNAADKTRKELPEQLRRSNEEDCQREGIFEMVSELRDAALPTNLPSELRARGVGGGNTQGASQLARFQDGSEAFERGVDAEAAAEAEALTARGARAAARSNQRMEVLYAHNAAGQEIVVELEEASDKEDEDERFKDVLPSKAAMKRKAKQEATLAAAAAAKKLKAAPVFLTHNTISGNSTMEAVSAAAAAAGQALRANGGGSRAAAARGSSDSGSSSGDGDGYYTDEDSDARPGVAVNEDDSSVVLLRRGDLVVLRPASDALPDEAKTERFRKRYLLELERQRAEIAASRKASQMWSGREEWEDGVQ